MSKAFGIITTSLLLVLVEVLTFMSPSLVRADADEAFSTSGRLQAGTSFAQPWVVSNAMDDQCKKMAAGRGQHGDVFFEYCLAQAPGNPAAGKAYGCYAKHPMELEKFKACLADAKASPPLPKSSPKSSAPFPSPPQMPSEDEIAARIDADVARQQSLKQKIFEAAGGVKDDSKTAALPPEVSERVFKSAMATMQAKGSADLDAAKANDRARVGEVLEHYSILKRIDPESAIDMLNVAAKAVAKSEWKNAGGTGEIGAQHSLALERLAKKNPEVTLVDCYKGKGLPGPNKRLNALNLTAEEIRDISRVFKSDRALSSLQMRRLGWGKDSLGRVDPDKDNGPFANMLGITPGKVADILFAEKEKLDEEYKKTGYRGEDSTVYDTEIYNRAASALFAPLIDGKVDPSVLKKWSDYRDDELNSPNVGGIVVGALKSINKGNVCDVHNEADWVAGNMPSPSCYGKIKDAILSEFKDRILNRNSHHF